MAIARAASVASGVLLAVTLLQATMYKLTDFGAAFVAAVELYTQDLYFVIEIAANWLAGLFDYQIEIDRDKINFLILFVPMSLCVVTILLSLSWHYIATGDTIRIWTDSARFILMVFVFIAFVCTYFWLTLLNIGIEPIGTPPGRYDHLKPRAPMRSIEIHYFLMLTSVIGVYELIKSGFLRMFGNLDGVRLFVLASRTSRNHVVTVLAIFVLCVDWVAFF